MQNESSDCTTIEADQRIVIEHFHNNRILKENM